MLVILLVLIILLEILFLLVLLISHAVLLLLTLLTEHVLLAQPQPHISIKHQENVLAAQLDTNIMLLHTHVALFHHLLIILLLVTGLLLILSRVLLKLLNLSIINLRKLVLLINHTLMVFNVLFVHLASTSI